MTTKSLCYGVHFVQKLWHIHRQKIRKVCPSIGKSDKKFSGHHFGSILRALSGHHCGALGGRMPLPPPCPPRPGDFPGPRRPAVLESPVPRDAAPGPSHLWDSTKDPLAPNPFETPGGPRHLGPLLFRSHIVYAWRTRLGLLIGFAYMACALQVVGLILTSWGLLGCILGSSTFLCWIPAFGNLVKLDSGVLGSILTAQGLVRKNA